nr:uncharacterized protein LOC104095911 isoform X2 [Nicotiana tomentosiformis]
MNMTSASEKVESGDMPIWCFPVIIVVSIIYVICCFVVTFTNYSWRNAMLDLLFGLNIGVETYVTTAAQFSHTDLTKKKLAGWAMGSAFGGLICIFGDVYFHTRNSLTMQGQRLLVDVRGRPPVLARPHQNCLQTGFNKLRNLGQTLIDSSWEDKLRIAAGILQFLLRLAELFSRLFCSVHICTVLQEDFTAVPLLLAVLSSSKRIVRKCTSDVTSISCIFVGDLLREEREIEDPSSTLLTRIRGNNIVMGQGSNLCRVQYSQLCRDDKSASKIYGISRLIVYFIS